MTEPQRNLTDADAQAIADAVTGSTAEGRLAQAKAGMTAGIREAMLSKRGQNRQERKRSFTMPTRDAVRAKEKRDAEDQS